MQVYSVIGCDQWSFYCQLGMVRDTVTNMKVNHKVVNFVREDTRRYTHWATFW